MVRMMSAHSQAELVLEAQPAAGARFWPGLGRGEQLLWSCIPACLIYDRFQPACTSSGP